MKHTYFICYVLEGIGSIIEEISYFFERVGLSKIGFIIYRIGSWFVTKSFKVDEKSGFKSGYWCKYNKK